MIHKIAKVPAHAFIMSDQELDDVVGILDKIGNDIFDNDAIDLSIAEKAKFAEFFSCLNKAKFKKT